MIKQIAKLLTAISILFNVITCETVTVAPPGDGYEFASKGMATVTTYSLRTGISFKIIDTGCIEGDISPTSDSCDIYLSTDTIFAPNGMFVYSALDQNIGTTNSTVPCDSENIIYNKIQKIKALSSDQIYKAKIDINHGFYINCKNSSRYLFVPIGRNIGQISRLQFFWGNPWPVQ
jgi:hypothetical protein